jgi:hypothetical protein
MCDPIIDDSEIIEKEAFTKEVVNEYLEKRSSFDGYPLRHYSQLEMSFEESTVKRLLDKLHVPILHTKVTIFGGYTGNFAKCLRNLGMKVIFTDPLEEWVHNAIDSGFEAYRYSAAQIPRDIVKRTDLFATFECYPALNGESAIYTCLRFLTSEYGILFGESKYTRDEIDKEEGKKARLIYSFLPYYKVYSIKRAYREKGSLRLYHFSSDADNRRIITQDVITMKLLYDAFPSQTCITLEDIASLACKASLNNEVILRSIRRIVDIYQLHVPRSLRIYFPPNMFRVCSKVFTFDDSMKSALERICPNA